ncbi:hypothetical protein [Allomesorhizobium camelthorni]|uniref:Uncharacterized protein n=1 Tax=Allomesorhizobium camelthorni TaxID=475069 RepID=A0A6G4W731_9HYPH|nr:hypothetical protein [Mesorhizobium camelthorni]NGO50409.1 hypothetical protein [Mesorhizobium camelthorni]
MKRFWIAVEDKVVNSLVRRTQGMAGDRQFLAVIILANIALFLIRAIIPLVLIVPLVCLWWLL